MKHYRIQKMIEARGIGVAVLTCAVFPLLVGCADDEVRTLGAQATAGVDTIEVEDEAEAQMAAADTATRTAAEAARLALEEMRAEAAADSAARRDSLAALPPDTGLVDPPPPPAPAPRYASGEDPDFAARYGWPVRGPQALRGSILPNNRLVCYYGNPNSSRMGALGEYPKDEMLRRLQDEVAAWTAADPETPAKPCLHMVSVVAQGEAGTSGHYRSIMLDETVKMVHDWAREIDAEFIVDIQVGTDDIRNILPRFEWILTSPDVHLAVDPEFYMKDGTPPGRKIGTMDAADINYVTDYLAKLIREHDLPPKMLIIHRFTRGMVTNSANIHLRPEVQVVIDMDGWGAPWLKRDSYRDYIVREPVQYTGFKLFYHNDTKNGDALMSPADVLRLRPVPHYIQYQ